MLPEFDFDGQQHLFDGTALIIGLGGLGSPAAMYLASSGVGKLILVDDDDVEVSNLQRQIIHQESSIGLAKVDSAKRTLNKLNSNIEIECVPTRLDQAQLSEYIKQVDVVLDCTDNFNSRFLTNELCVRHKTPLVSAAAIRWEGQLQVYNPLDSTSACYACLYDHAPEQNLSCSENGIMSPVVGMMGVWQALEAIKVLAKMDNPGSGKLSIFDGLSGQWRQLNVKKNAQCRICAHL